ncbi:DUF4158 domain-containing protein [Nonomuraea sp. 10N515B]|uniref:DUF4158 domain-containing protein n=1 Tax=Nonomuraea sp. 10N515B TaxID=3457422 RepID=UPI003FCEBD6B
MPWLGFVSDEVTSAPPVAVARLAERLRVDPAALEGYGERAHTRSDHLRLAAEHLGWKSAPAGKAAHVGVQPVRADDEVEAARRCRTAPHRRAR